MRTLRLAAAPTTVRLISRELPLICFAMTTKTSSSRGAKHGHFTKGKSRRKHRYITPLTNAALTEALSTPKAGASGKFRYDMPSGTVVISSHATEKPPAKGTLYGYIVKGSGGWKPVTLSRGGLTGRKPDNTGKQLFDVSKPLAERLRILGAKPGDKLDDAKVARILRSMRTGAEQVTGYWPYCGAACSRRPCRSSAVAS